ncbi:hypothetical protein HD806DRAFT_308249 [Xylariaceae sp. AK1471]|nr:hypothetical protein HD806DRAFT_308249 [Xylariaceae sp. AK1471]
MIYIGCTLLQSYRATKPGESQNTQILPRMYRPRDSAYNMPPISPGLGDPPVYRDCERPRRRPRQPRHHRNHSNKPSKHHHHHFNRPSGNNTHFQRDSSNVRRNPWQSTESLELGLHPRMFDALHVERVYLLSTLQWHDRQALDLFRQLPALEENINRLQYPHLHPHPYRHRNPYQGTNSKAKVKVKVNGIPVTHADQAREDREEGEELRKAHRQRLWLFQQIEDNVSAERRLLKRLGDIHVEIQCRERWCQVERERAASEPRLGHHLYQNHGLLQANTHLYQPGYESGYGQGPLPSSLYAGDLSIFPEQHGCDGLGGNPLEFALLPTRYYGSLEYENWNWNYNWNDGMWRPPALYQAGGGGEQVQPSTLYPINGYTDWGDREGVDNRRKEDFNRLAGEKTRDWPSGFDNSLDARPQGRRWSFPSVHYEWAEEGTKNGEAHKSVGYCVCDGRANISKR